MDRVFICYSHKDSVFVDKLTSALKASGVPIWRDVDDIPKQIAAHTQSWWNAALDGLKQCSHMIVVLSPDSANHWESAALWDSFLQQGKPVYPIVYRDCDLPEQLADLPWWDFRGDIAPPLHDLLDVLSHEEKDISSFEPSPEVEPKQPKWLMTLPSGVILLVLILVVIVLGGLAVAGVYLLRDNPSVVAGVEAAQTWGPTIVQPIIPDTPTAAPATATEVLPPTALSLSDCREAGLPEAACEGVESNEEWTPFTRTFNGTEMALVPAGCFMMGSKDGESDESPVHEVCFKQPFWIDVYEVTAVRFIEFLNEAGNLWVDDSTWLLIDYFFYYSVAEETWIVSEDYENYPVDGIAWDAADAYCEWAGRRLPTEAEWEYVARGPDSLVYPWGDKFVGENVEYWGRNCLGVCEIGSMPGDVSWVGAYNLGGNAREWVNDWYDAGYYATLNDGVVNPQGPENGEDHVFKGGSYLDSGSDVTRSASRIAVNDFLGGGFRCVHLQYRPPAETATPIPQPTISSTSTPIPTPTTTPPAVLTQEALQPFVDLALAGVSSNDEWVPVIQDFDGVKMALVPVGNFMMGSTDEEIDQVMEFCERIMGRGKCARKWFEDEQPPHQVFINEPFWIDVYEENLHEFDFSDFGMTMDEPIMMISWADAQAHCQSRGARLPTEAEWEFAVRGPDGWLYPWGGDIFGDYPANMLNDYARISSGNDDYPGVAPVGSYPDGISWVGAYDLGGNVSEWVDDVFSPDYFTSTMPNDPSESSDYAIHVVKGGSWYSSLWEARGAERAGFDVGEYDFIGFRCVRSVGE